MTGLVSLFNTHVPDHLSGKTVYGHIIIDTGASDHMTGDLKSLFDVSKIIPCPIRLPNGESAIATKERKYNLGGRIVLHHVLYVPNL